MSENQKEKVRGKVWRWFAASGLTYKELAKITGLGVSTVNMIVRGIRPTRPFSRRTRGKVIATLVWRCRKAGRDPRLMRAVALIKCSCGKEHLIYSTDGAKLIHVERGQKNSIQ